jgi:hypothetical protein
VFPPFKSDLECGVNANPDDNLGFTIRCGGLNTRGHIKVVVDVEEVNGNKASIPFEVQYPDLPKSTRTASQLLYAALTGSMLAASWYYGRNKVVEQRYHRRMFETVKATEQSLSWNNFLAAQKVFENNPRRYRSTRDDKARLAGLKREVSQTNESVLIAQIRDRFTEADEKGDTAALENAFSILASIYSDPLYGEYPLVEGKRQLRESMATDCISLIPKLYAKLAENRDWEAAAILKNLLDGIAKQEYAAALMAANGLTAGFIRIRQAADVVDALRSGKLLERYAKTRGGLQGRTINKARLLTAVNTLVDDWGQFVPAYELAALAGDNFQATLRSAIIEKEQRALSQISRKLIDARDASAEYHNALHHYGLSTGAMEVLSNVRAAVDDARRASRLVEEKGSLAQSESAKTIFARARSLIQEAIDSDFAGVQPARELLAFMENLARYAASGRGNMEILRRIDGDRRNREYSFDIIFELGRYDLAQDYLGFCAQTGEEDDIGPYRERLSLTIAGLEDELVASIRTNPEGSAENWFAIHPHLGLQIKERFRRTATAVGRVEAAMQRARAFVQNGCRSRTFAHMLEAATAVKGGSNNLVSYENPALLASLQSINNLMALLRLPPLQGMSDGTRPLFSQLRSLGDAEQKAWLDVMGESGRYDIMSAICTEILHDNREYQRRIASDANLNDLGSRFCAAAYSTDPASFAIARRMYEENPYIPPEMRATWREELEHMSSVERKMEIMDRLVADVEGRYRYYGLDSITTQCPPTLTDLYGRKGPFWELCLAAPENEVEATFWNIVGIFEMAPDQMVLGTFDRQGKIAVAPMTVVDRAAEFYATGEYKVRQMPSELASLREANREVYEMLASGNRLDPVRENDLAAAVKKMVRPVNRGYLSAFGELTQNNTILFRNLGLSAKTQENVGAVMATVWDHGFNRLYKPAEDSGCSLVADIHAAVKPLTRADRNLIDNLVGEAVAKSGVAVDGSKNRFKGNMAVFYMLSTLINRVASWN